MRKSIAAGFLLVTVLMIGCSDDDSATTTDAMADTQVDTAPDVAADVIDPAWANVPAPTEVLFAGAARRSLGMPVGIPTVGNGPEPGPKSRFAVIYPATQAQHTDPNVKALVMRRDGKAMVLVRTETIGVWQDIIEDVRAWLRVRGRADLAEGLIVGATHTHSSGGRVFDHPVGEIAVDNFLPPLYQQLRDALGQVILDADARAVSARFGYASIQVPQLHKDRRCENPDYQDDQMGLMKIEAADGGLVAVVINYAMHGTVLGRGENHLSYDAPGAIEQAVETTLGTPMEALYFQSWAGDMAPGAAPNQATDTGYDLLPGFVRIDGIGAEAASLIIPALAQIQTDDRPTLDVKTVRIPLSDELINPDGVFSDYPYGAIYCFSPDENCPEDGGAVYSSLGCIGFPIDYTIFSTLLTAARIGDLALVTLPGEPVTRVGTTLRDTVKSEGGWDEVFVIGYAQTYLSYLLFEDDFWWGGYEGASALMGPGFGRYLVDRAANIAQLLKDPNATLDFEPVAFDFGHPLEFPPFEIEPAMGTLEIIDEPEFDGMVKEVTFVGGDPAAGNPVVTLEREDEAATGSWSAVLRQNDSVFDSTGPEIVLNLTVEPTYSSDKGPIPRVFSWTARMPTRFAVPPAGGQLEGTFRFRIEGKTPDRFRFESQPFTVVSPQ